MTLIKKHFWEPFAVLTLILIIGCSYNKELIQGYVDARLIYVSTSRSGRLIELETLRGNEVTKGDSLFKLEQEPESMAITLGKAKIVEAEARVRDLQKGQRPSEIAAIEARLAEARTNVEISKITYERRITLLKNSAVTKESVDQAEAQYKEAISRVNNINAELETARLGGREDAIEAAKAQVEQAKWDLDRLKWESGEKSIFAPASGYIFDTYYEVGETVPANKPILSILVPEEIYAVFFIHEELLSRIHLGDSIQVKCDNCEKNLTATISFISPKAEYTPPVIYSEDRRSKLVYRVEAVFPEKISIRMHPGQPIDLKIINY